MLKGRCCLWEGHFYILKKNCSSLKCFTSAGMAGKSIRKNVTSFQCCRIFTRKLYFLLWNRWAFIHDQKFLCFFSRSTACKNRHEIRKEWHEYIFINRWHCMSQFCDVRMQSRLIVWETTKFCLWSTKAAVLDLFESFNDTRAWRYLRLPNYWDILIKSNGNVLKGSFHWFWYLETPTKDSNVHLTLTVGMISSEW